MLPSNSGDLISKALKLALPISGGYLLVVGTLLFEVGVIGHDVGGTGVAAIGLAATLSLVIVLAFHAVELANQTIVARRYGEGNLKETGRCLDNALLLSFGISVPLTGLLFLLGPRIFFLAASREIELLAFDYFRWRLPGIPFFVALLAMIGFFNGISRPKVYVFIFAAILIIDVALIYLLVGGRMGFPAMGIKGAGLAASLSAFIGFVIFLGVLMKRRYRETYGCFQFSTSIDKRVLAKLMGLGTPIFVQQFFTNFSIYLFQLLISAIPDGGISLAASTIARNVSFLTYLPSLGMGIAAATMVSQHLGAADHQPAKQSGFACWALGAIFMVSAGLVFILFGEPLSRIFLEASASTNGDAMLASDQAKTIKLAGQLLLIVGVYQIFESMNTILGKALQGAGITRFVMISTVAMQWLFFLPVAYVLAIQMGYGAIGAWIAFGTQISVLGVVFFIKFRAGAWKQVTF